ncbi:TetR/AcrR family transcriptional regulator [Paenibacillus sp. FSL H7-0331]|uniref:TetR/AcrR family transcriptional regulator n=1 Tax=Paenibacillus sp. FSL H7-0331 TaxID=1920421 RepID=UPI00096CB3A6|nr:TetR/AcrR family transcriptional regulator [Paenibacillus sp. FSL H7-0331]OMF15947.1 TetR family transcriptional regulator [Paenibacillus sp. FSL H7-0331]
MADKKNSRDILIEVASRLFRIHGYYGVGLNDIIEESGIPKGSLYHYFPKGKEELAIAAIHYTKEIVIGEIHEVFTSIEDPVQAIQTHIYQLSEGIFDKTNAFPGLSIGTIAGEKHSTSEPIRIACHSAFEEWQSMYTKKLLEAGYSDKQSKDLSIVINALIEGGIVYSLTATNGAPLRAIAEQIPLLLSIK